MNSYFKKLYIISKYTFIEIFKSKVLVNVFFLGLGLLLITFVGSQFTYGVPERVALDFGLGTLSLSSVAIAIFLGVNLVSKEVENRTVYMVLSRPIKRSQFILGRCLGLMGILIVNVLLLGIMTISFSAFLGGEISSLIFWAVIFSIIEASIILLVSVGFSLVTNTTMSVIYSLAIFVLGHALSDALVNRFTQRSPVFSTLLNGYSLVFPNFSKLNIKEFILYKQSLEPSFLFGAGIYGIFYVIILFIALCLIFDRKSLD